MATFLQLFDKLPERRHAYFYLVLRNDKLMMISANISVTTISAALTDQSKLLSFDEILLDDECNFCHVTLLYTRRSHVVFAVANARFFT